MLLEKKITRFSLTDYDTIDGIQKARMLSRDRITFISGIEFTCQEKTPDAVSLPFSIHLLGYGFDENDPDLIKALEARKQRVLEVFESLLDAANISIEQAIRLIHKAGGRAVWAHPLFVYRNFEKRKLEKEEIQVILQYLKTCGLDGIEANYSAFDSSEKEWIYRVAQDAKLFCASGSDFHGSKGRDFMGMKVLHEDWIG